MHGFWNYCKQGKCKVCSTPWPVMQPTPLKKYLEKINYFAEYTTTTDGLIMPRGMTGQQVLNLYKDLLPEYIKEYGKITR